MSGLRDSGNPALSTRSRPLHRYLFRVRLQHGAPITPLEVIAYDSFDAVRSLPDDLTYWDFATHADGRYSIPVADQQAA